MDEAMLFKFGKCVNYSKSHTVTPTEKIYSETGMVWDTGPIFTFENPLNT